MIRPVRVKRRRPSVELAADEAVRPAAHRRDHHAGRSARSPDRHRRARRPTPAPGTAARGPPSRSPSRRRRRRPSLDASTSSTAATNASRPRTSSFDTNSPAIELDSLSSLVADERTTRAIAPVVAEVSPRLPDRARSAGADSSARRAGRRAVVRTNPGSTGRPAAPERARLAAFAPTSSTAVEPAASRRTTTSGPERSTSGVEPGAHVLTAITSSPNQRCRCKPRRASPCFPQAL